MPRAQERSKTATTMPKAAFRRAPAQRMGTSEARQAFSRLIQMLAKQKTPSKSLLDRAIEVGPQRKGGAWIIPEVDGQAAVARIEELSFTVDELQDEIENIAFALLLQERLVNAEESSDISGGQLIRDIGFPDLADGLPE